MLLGPSELVEQRRQDPLAWNETEDFLWWRAVDGDAVLPALGAVQDEIGITAVVSSADQLLVAWRGGDVDLEAAVAEGSCGCCGDDARFKSVAGAGVGGCSEQLAGSSLRPATVGSCDDGEDVDIANAGDEAAERC